MSDKNTAFPIIIVAPSGAGKTTICKHILATLPNIKYSVSATTRKPRDGEVEGNDYYFISHSVFYKWIESGKFIEWAEVYGELYGTPKEPFTRYLNEGYHVLLAIDIQGARAVKRDYPDAVSIFILPPSISELKNRLFKRGSTNEINKRLESVNAELSHLDEFDYVVINDKLADTVEKIISIITEEQRKRGYHGG